MQGGKHSAAAYSELEKWIYGSAKATIDSFVVSAGTGMNASISTGAGIIYDTIARRIATDATETATVPTASASFNRIDSVVAYIDTAISPTTSVTDNTNDILKFVVVAGTAAATPVAPTGSAIVAAIGAGKPYLVLADILLPQNATNLSGATFTNRAPIINDVSGWRQASESWAYASWASTTRIGVITVPSGATTRYQKGMRLRIEQPSGTKYGIIVAVASTSLTVFFPSGTTLDNAAISYPAYSTQKAPFGFDLNPVLWTVSATDSTNRQATTDTYTSYGGTTLPVGIGAWEIAYRLDMRITYASGGNPKRGYVTLSSDGSTETDPEMTNTLYMNSPTLTTASQTMIASKKVNFTAARTLTFLGRVSSTGATAQIDNSSTQALSVSALCAYL